MTYTGGEQGFDLAVALNYGYAAGSPQLLRFVTEHIEMIHNPPYDDWQSCLTTGTTSAMEMAFRILCDRGDWVLFEEYTYSGALDIARTQGLNVLGIRMDEMGLIPEDLDVRLKN